jgi:murein DD-endopeptidase MepM/ murein hydrolase activator NlpD
MLQNKFFIFIFLMVLSLVLTTSTAYALRIDDLRTQISMRNIAIASLEQEILAYQNELNKIGREATTLEVAIDQFNVTIKKLNADVYLTISQSEAAELRIEALEIGIKQQEEIIQRGIMALGESIRRMEEAENRTLVEMVLSATSLSGFWDDVDSIQQFQNSIQTNLKSIRELKKRLGENKIIIEEERKQLLLFQGNLNSKKAVVEEAKKNKDVLLRETKNKESGYQNILEERLLRKKEFEKEIFALESELKLEIDPKSFPAPLQGILNWPLDDILITQEFGNTAFSKSNPGVYNGNGHNGVDFRASLGTAIKVTLNGTILGIGNTDEVRGCYSYGKWILVRHNNGLSSLYAHLSVISVVEGANVNTGDIIGYSGNTGYSTGPHLHFGVYASQGVQIQKFEKSINCKNTYIPIADLRAYLNPLSYLPEI